MAPIYLLLIGFIIVITGAVLISPKWGVIKLWKKIHKNTERVLIEDSLKQIFNAEYNGNSCRIVDFGDLMNIGKNKSGQIIKRLEKTNLIKIENQDIKLTEQGRDYALRVIRVHRILERYLSEQSGLKEFEWHQEAEYMEHSLTFEEANKIAAQMGNPLFDPHGDPIPTADGKILKREGILLSDFAKGELGYIIHIEDEPIEVFSQISALGIYPGMQVKITDMNDKRIQFIADGQDCVLAPLFAKNITVVKDQSKKLKKKLKTLSNLKTGEEAFVQSISPALRGVQRRRLMDFGIVPGTKIRAELESLSGDPRGYFVRGTTVAVRNKQAESIFIADTPSED